MKRRISRREVLAPFSLDLARLELLTLDLVRLFGAASPTLCISLEPRSSEELDFDSIDELRQNLTQLPKRVTDVSVSVDQWANDRAVSLKSGRVRPMVSATSSDEAWSAGALAICQRHALDGRAWYHWIRPWYFWSAAAMSGSLPGIWHYIFGTSIPSTAFLVILLAVLNVLLWTLYFSFGRLFPSLVLVLRPEENWARRNATELTLVFAVLAVLVSIAFVNEIWPPCDTEIWPPCG